MGTPRVVIPLKRGRKSTLEVIGKRDGERNGQQEKTIRLPALFDG
jgi:hypothetical protein